MPAPAGSGPQRLPLGKAIDIRRSKVTDRGKVHISTEGRSLGDPPTQVRARRSWLARPLLACSLHPNTMESIMQFRIVILTVLSVLIAAPAMAAGPGGSGHGKGHAAHGMKAHKKLKPQTHCPISGKELKDKKNFVDIEGQRVYLCCEACTKAFVKNPEKAFTKLAKLGEVAESVQKTCPICGEQVNPKESPHVMVRGRRIFFACPGCDKQILAKPDKALAKIDKETKASAAKTPSMPMGGGEHKGGHHKGGEHKGHDHGAHGHH